MKKKDSIIKGIVNSVLPVILAFAFGAIIIAAIGGKSAGNIRGTDQKITFNRERIYEYIALCITSHSDRACNCNYIQSKSV